MQRSLTKSIVTLFAVAIVTLVALLFAVFLPADSTPAYAAEPVEGTTTTEQVSDASGVMDADALKAAVEKGGEVVLGSDITADVVVPATVTVTIDLNGHTLTNNSDHTIINYGTLTVEDSSTGETGKVDNVTHGKAAIYNEVDATFTLASGTLDRTKEAGTSSSSSGDNSYYTLLNHGTAYINGGTIQQGGLEVGKYSSLVENGWYDGSKNTEKKPSIMTVNGGTFLGGLNSIKNDDYGELTIKNATVKNVAQAALLNWNVATIKGGSFSADGGSAVILNGYINDTMDKGELTITGGTFTTNGGDFPLIARMDGSKPTGGVITVTVTSTNADLVAAAINVPGVTTYVKEGDAVTEMSVSDLAGLKKALSIETVKKITLACDITSDESLFFERDVTLDMNGYELTVAKATTHPVVIDKANVTIVNGNITVGEGVYANLNAILVTNGATLTLGTKSDEAVVEDDGVFVTTNSGYGIVVSGGATLNMYGGSVTAKWCALGTNNTTGTAAFNVYGATLESTDDSAIFMSCYTEVYLKETAVIGKTAIDIRIGKLTVDGGSITSTYDGYHEMTYDEVTASGTLTGGDGSAILVKANYYYDNANKSNEVSIKISETTEIKGAVTIYDLDGVGNMLPNDKVVDQTEALQTFVDSLKNSHASVETHFYDVALPAGGSEDGTIVNVDKVFVADNESVTATVSSLDELRAAFAEKKIGKIVIGADFEISGNRIEIGDINDPNAATRSITLDLNGHTLKIGTIRVSDTDSSANTAALYLGYNVSLTLTDTVDTGIIDASGANDLTVPIGAMRSSSTLTVKSGTIIVDTDRESCVFARGGGKIVIIGGTFINNCTSEYAYGGGRPLTVNIENNSTSTIDITGGTFKGRNPMSGDDNTDVAFVSKDSKVVEYKSGDMKVVDQNSEVTGDDVVAVYTYADNETGDTVATVYTEDALRAAFAEKKIGKIVIGADFEISGNRIEIGDINDPNAATRSITLDLNGHTLKIGTIRVSDTDSSANTAALYLGYNVSLTLTDTVDTGIIDASGANDLTVPIGAMRSSSTLTVKSGTIIVDTDRESCVFARGGGKIVIIGGTFINNCTSEYAYGGGRPLTVNIENNSTSTIDITGGTFKGRNPMSGDDNTDVAFVSKDSKVVEYKSGDMKVVDQNSEVTGDDVVAVYTYADNETGDTVATVYTEDALRAALADKNYDTVVLGADIGNASETFVIDRPVTLDLNGYTLENKNTTSGNYLLIEGGNSEAENIKVTIRNGNISSGDAAVIVMGYVDVVMENVSVKTDGRYGLELYGECDQSVTAEGCTFEGDTSGVVVFGAEKTGMTAAFSATGCTIKGGDYGVSGNGTYHLTTIDIVDSKVSSDRGTAIYHPQVGTLTISGGSEISGISGIEMRAGTLTITGGTITATGEFAADPNGNGATTSGVAVAMMQHTTERDLTLNITGGEFNGAYAVYQQNIQNNDSGTLTMSLTGGTFNGNVDSENCTEYISGGQYSVKPAAEAFKPGFDGVEYDGYYVVIKTTADDIAALLAARIDAQADVRTYAAVLGIDWKAMEALADTDDVAAAALDAYNAIGNATSEGYVAIARSAAMDALDAYAAAMAESDALASAITDAQKEVREYAAARGYAWADIADTAVLDAYNAIASVQAVDGVDDAKADAISAVREYLDGLESSGAESELEAAKLKAQTTVKMYIASADIGGWTNLLLINENGDRVEKDAVAPIFAMYDMIEESTTVADIDAYMWKAISQVDTYVNALENWRKAAADEVTAAAQETAENANDAVVVPTSVYAAINGAVNYTEVNAYKTNALAEIADIRAYRADIAEQGSELDLIYGTLTEFKNAFDVLDASLTGENNAFDTLLKDVQNAITTAQNAITGGTDESSESLASIKSYLENTIYKAMTDFKADVDTAFDDLGSNLAAYGDVLIALRDALVGDGTDGSVGKIDEILADIADAQSDITNIKTTVGSLATTEDLTTAVTDIKGALTVSEGKITSAITAAQNAITSAIASVRTDIDALETALAGYESDFEGLSGTLAQINSSLGGKIDAAQADIDAIKTAIDALGTPASAAAVTELATAIDELKAAVDEISVSVSAPSAVETVKTEATADIAEWLNAYVDEIVNSVTASNGKAYAAAVTFAPALETTDGDLYAKLLKAFDKDNADLVLKYYNDALTAIDAATTADEVNTAVATFKAQVASVEAASGNTSDLTVVYVLLIVVLVVLVVAVVVAAVLSRKRRVPVGYAPAPTPAPAPATSETTEQTEKAAPAEKAEVTDDTAATAVEPEEAPDEDAGERVVINASVKTFDEAYDEMSDTLKDMFEKVREYALSKNGATGVRIGNGVRVKRGSKQIVKLTVRRGYPVAMFVLENEMLKDYRRTAGSSAKLKVPATELVLREPSDLDAAYMMVDLAVRQLDADVEAAKERRRELLRERRRQRREAMEAAKAAQAAQADATTEQAGPTATEQNEAATPEQAVDEDKTE